MKKLCQIDVRIITIDQKKVRMAAYWRYILHSYTSKREELISCEEYNPSKNGNFLRFAFHIVTTHAPFVPTF